MGMTLAQLAAEKQNEYKDEIILANVNGSLKNLEKNISLTVMLHLLQLRHQ